MNLNIINVNKQSGLSIIELLIAVTIGLFLLSGIATSYVTSIKSSSNRDQASMLEDNGRLALEVITKALKHAGYANGQVIDKRFIKNKSQITSETCGLFKNVEDPTIFPANATSNSTFDSTDGDVITSVYYGDNKLNTDCSGTALALDCRLESGNPENSKIYNSFYLKKDADDSLMCAGSRQDKSQVVAEGIENIQFLYGVDSGSVAGDLKQDRFVNATELFNQGLEDSVMSIQVAILVRSLLPVNTKAELKKYMLLDTEVTAGLHDRYRREVFTTTIRLRNTL